MKQTNQQRYQKHVDNYLTVYRAITGKPIDRKEMILQSRGECIIFQKVFNLRRGKGTRKEDYPPYRAVGPVTEEEYLSREERYDKHIREKLNLDPEKMTPYKRKMEKITCLSRATIRLVN